MHAEFGDVGDTIAEGCIADLQKQAEYLTNMKVVVYFPDRSFSEQGYEDEAISVSSNFFTTQIDPLKPSWISGKVQENILEDETGYF